LCDVRLREKDLSCHLNFFITESTGPYDMQAQDETSHMADP
jgi:hypothetical protein